MIDTIDVHSIRRYFEVTAALMERDREMLCGLDANFGDGDIGLTMARGFRAAADDCAESTQTDLGRLVFSQGMQLAEKASSTMGTLVASGFMESGKAMRGKERLSLADLATAGEAFVQGLMKRGKAQAGEKTILDSLIPAVESLRKSSEDGDSLLEAANAAVSAAQEGAEKAKGMQSKHGRAARYGEQTIGQEDPGAVVGVRIVEGLRAALGD